MDDFPIHLGPGAHGSPLGRCLQPGPQGAHLIGIRMADVIEHLREIGHDIGGRTAFGNHIMNARVHIGMFAHHIDHHVHRLDPVERAAPALWRASRMG